MKVRKLVRSSLAAAGALVLSALAILPALTQEDFGFMPKGGKTLLVELLGSPPDVARFREIGGARRSEEEWLKALPDQAKALDERQRRTLAAYLAINMPLPEGALAQADKPEKLQAVLPRDGREIAWNECQFCHSFFTSHLTQDRAVQAWLNMFESPFHREMKVTPQERREFAHYSTINMPMKIEDVPPDLRF